MRIKIATCLLLVFFCIKAHSQIKISGSECIVAGTEYQYEFYGKFDRQSEISVCVEGGLITANDNTCYTVRDSNHVRVIWNEGISKGKITVTSSSRTASFSVRPTRALQGGKIDTVSKIQHSFYTGISKTINCAVPKGGSCNSQFTYQWEHSDDNLHWAEIKGAVSQNLSFSPDSEKSFFLRRKVFESTSNSIAYSDVALIVVNSQPGTN